MPRDPLAALARLRRLETDAARRRLAEADAQFAAATGRLAAAELALREEALAGDGNYAAWLPAGLAARTTAARTAGHAAAAATAARAGVGDAAAAERALAEWRAVRAAAARRHDRRAEATRLDDLAPRRADAFE